jgi:hypothetical protein
MKPNTAVQNLTLTNSVESVKMGFDVASTSHIIGLLTDLYSRKILALVREYSTNAWDSHVEAGNPGPIHIKRPNRMDPTFVVQDFGVGLSRDEIATVYSMYGTSTKRNTNEATGMLGLGCKSGLTYAVQFTVDAVKDGMRTVATVGKGADGVGEIQILAHQPTMDPSGVSIRIPVELHDIDEFNSTINEFFWAWRGGVLVDGEEPKNVTNDPEWTALDPDVYIREFGYGADSHYVVQGNVPYRFAKKYDVDGVQIVAFVPIGMVDFTPSREDLHFTDRTEEVVREIRQFVTGATEQTFQDDLSKCKNDWERLCLHMKWRNLLPRGGRRGRGGRSLITWQDFQRFQKFPKGDFGWYVTVHRSGWKHTSAGGYTIKRTKAMNFPTEEATEARKDKAFFVRNFEPRSFTDSHYNRLLLAGMPEDQESFYVLPPSYNSKVATVGFPGLNWKTVPHLPKKPRVKGNTTARLATTEYPVYRGGANEHNRTPTFAKDIDHATTVYKVCDNRKHTLSGDYSLRNLLNANKVGVVLITRRQEEKFKKLCPKVKSLSDWHQAETERVRKLITPEIKSILAKSDQVKDAVERFGPYKDRITNPHFLTYLDDRKVPNDLLEEIRYHGLMPQQSITPDLPSLSKVYPLTQEFDPRWRRYTNDPKYVDHLIEYINANVPDDWDKEGEAE